MHDTHAWWEDNDIYVPLLLLQLASKFEIAKHFLYYCLVREVHLLKRKPLLYALCQSEKSIVQKQALISWV
jgi:hypothetical protein